MGADMDGTAQGKAKPIPDFNQLTDADVPWGYGSPDADGVCHGDLSIWQPKGDPPANGHGNYSQRGSVTNSRVVRQQPGAARRWSTALMDADTDDMTGVLPPIRIMNDLLELGTVSILTGYGGHGKSTRMVQEAVMLAQEGKRAAMYAMEDNVAITKARLHAYIEHHKLPKSLLKNIKALGPDSEFPRLGNPEEADEWTAEMMEMFSGPDWHCLFIDNLTKVASGHQDLNNDQAAADLVGRFVKIAQATHDGDPANRSHVRVLAHPRKPYSSKYTDPPTMHDIRGSGAFSQLIRAGHVMFKKRIDGTPVYQFIYDKDNGRPDKSGRDGFLMVSRAPDAWPQHETVGVLESHKIPDPIAGIPTQKCLDAVKAILSADPKDRRESVKAVGWAGNIAADELGLGPDESSRVEAILKAWVKSGVLKIDSLPARETGGHGGRKTAIYEKGPQYYAWAMIPAGEYEDLDLSNE